MTLRFAPAATAIAVPAFVSFGASAQQMTPGLWEHRVNFRSQSGDMERSMADAQARMAALPPDQRKMVEQMMAKRGVSFGAQGTTARILRDPCTGTDPSSGEGEIHFTSDKAFTGRAVVNSTRNGKPERMDMDTSGKWLGGDCGELKPGNAGKP